MLPFFHYREKFVFLTRRWERFNLANVIEKNATRANL